MYAQNYAFACYLISLDSFPQLAHSSQREEIPRPSWRCERFCEFGIGKLLRSEPIRLGNSQNPRTRSARSLNPLPGGFSLGCNCDCNTPSVPLLSGFAGVEQT